MSTRLGAITNKYHELFFKTPTHFAVTVFVLAGAGFGLYFASNNLAAATAAKTACIDSKPPGSATDYDGCLSACEKQCADVNLGLLGVIFMTLGSGFIAAAPYLKEAIATLYFRPANDSAAGEPLNHAATTDYGVGV